jgi:hypothetical protein
MTKSSPKPRYSYIPTTYDELDAHFEYDPETGRMKFKTTRIRTRSWSVQRKGNRVREEDVWCNGRRVDTNEVAYVLGTGEELNGRTVMHRDGNRSNLRLENLVATALTPKQVEAAEADARNETRGYQSDSKTAPVPLPPLARLKKLFDYDPDAGVLRWRKDSVSRYGVRLAGDVVGTPDARGFLRVNLRGRVFSVHRLIWKYHFEQDPGRRDVLHDDGDPGNNHISNLKAGRLTFTAPKGVRFDPDRAQWKASFRFGGITTQLGYFETGEEAAEMVKEARAAMEAEFGTP